MLFRIKNHDVLDMLVASAASRFVFRSVGFKILVITSPLGLLLPLWEKSHLDGVEHAAKFHLAFEFIFLVLYIDFYG